MKSWRIKINNFVKVRQITTGTLESYSLDEVLGTPGVFKVTANPKNWYLNQYLITLVHDYKYVTLFMDREHFEPINKTNWINTRFTKIKAELFVELR